MTKGSILIVEDNSIVAKDIERRLVKLGYTASGTAASGPEAIQKATETRPDLVLMDIKLRGAMDGVEAAAEIRRNLDIPVIYLTAYADDRTLARAKVTEPFGYIVKPFDENALRTNVEITLVKHEAERKLRESEQWLATTLHCIGDATMATDGDGRIKLMNPMAESLTGFSQDEVQGRDWREVLQAFDEKTRRPIDIPLTEADERAPWFPPTNELSMVDRNGMEISVEVTGTPIADDKGKTIGAVIIFRDVTERKVTADALRRDHDLLHAIVQGTSDMIFLKNLEGRFIMINDAGVRTLGRPESEIIGKTDFELFDPPTANEMTRAQDRASSTGEAQTFECRITSVGVERTYLVSTEPCRGRDGRPMGVVGIARDITDFRIEPMPKSVT